MKLVIIPGIGTCETNTIIQFVYTFSRVKSLGEENYLEEEFKEDLSNTSLQSLNISNNDISEVPGDVLSQGVNQVFRVNLGWPKVNQFN